MKKLVIIPAYNEQGNILKTVNDVRTNAPDFDYVILTEDRKAYVTAGVSDSFKLADGSDYETVLIK